MQNGFAGLIGRWYQRHTAGHTPVQKGVFHATSAPLFTRNKPPDFFEQKGVVKGANSEPALSPPAAFGAAASGRQSLDQPEIFEGMVGFMNLCRIARAADNLEEMLGEMAGDEEMPIELKATEDSAPLLAGALGELNDALKPYRNARELSRARR